MLVTAMLFILTTAPTCDAEPLPIPTRAEVIAFDVDAYQPGELCVPFSLKKDDRCKETRKAVELKAKPLQELTQLLRDRASYDATRAMKCHEPRHLVQLYYKTSQIDGYEVCLACENTARRGSNAFVGCEPGGKSSMPDVMTFTPEALAKVQAILAKAKVGLLAKPDVKH